MKIKTILLRLGMIWLHLFVCGCASSVESVTPTVVPSTPILKPVTPTVALTPVPTLGLSSTPTIVPTLSVDKAQIKLLELLSNNGGCRIPCLWGIMPGKSTYAEAQAILLPLSSISELTGFIRDGGGIFPVYTENNLLLKTIVGFNVDLSTAGRIVQRIGFQASVQKPNNGDFIDIFDSGLFSERVGFYSLPSILSKVGVPSSIMIATFGEPLPRNGTGGFDILLLYLEQGVLVNYTTPMQLISTNVRGCPSNAHVEMELYPPGNGNAFFELLEQTDWSVKMNYYKSLEEVTSMSLEEFYEIFRESTDHCIETPASLWPIPEN